MLLGYNPADSDDSILTRIRDQLAREADAGQGFGGFNEKAEDYRFFARLLLSHKKYPHLVTTPPRVEDGEYARRQEYTNHPKEQDAWPYLLLSEVEIGYRTDAISPKIELIDLPGLGARLVSDDQLTKSFLPQLDGALVFQSSEQVAAKEAYDLLAQMGGLPAMAREPCGTLVEVLCGQPEQKYGVRLTGGTACICEAWRPLNQSALARSMATIRRRGLPNSADGRTKMKHVDCAVRGRRTDRYRRAHRCR